MARRRLLDTAEAAEFCKLSIPHWRRLYRAGKVPSPVRLSTRKYGWRLGDLVDFIDNGILQGAGGGP
jgi:predicted DNA-binding transcriptional regulator AlpA